MATLKSRVERLEAVARRRSGATLPALVCVNPDAIQQAEIDRARAAGRVVITIRCANPIELPPELDRIIEVDELDGVGNPKPDMTPITRPGW